MCFACSSPVGGKLFGVSGLLRLIFIINVIINNITSINVYRTYTGFTFYGRGAFAQYTTYILVYRYTGIVYTSINSGINCTGTYTKAQSDLMTSVILIIYLMTSVILIIYLMTSVILIIYLMTSVVLIIYLMTSVILIIYLTTSVVLIIYLMTSVVLIIYLMT